MPALVGVVLSAVLLLAGCGTRDDGGTPSIGRSLTVDLRPVRNTTARGEVTLVQEARHVRVAVRLSGLRSRWSYTLFLAERGDCGGTEPGGARTVPLAGALRTLASDLPQLVSDTGGHAELTLRVPGTLSGPGNDWSGRALVVQPDGYGRAACGGVPAA